MTTPLPPWTTLLLATLLMMPGCLRTSVLDDHATAALAERDYPAGVEYGQDLDIVVERAGHRVTLVNRTAEPVRGVELWLNRQYVRGITSIEIGDDNTFDLRTFVNRFGEPFPIALLLAPDRARPLVSAELYDAEAGVRHRLLVQPMPE